MTHSLPERAWAAAGSDRFQDLILAALWLLLVVVALTTRPLLPIDETRYLSVAWEMWRQHSFLVPTLNGEAYSHKPPLLFWLIDAGWWLFGVQEWWGRLVAPLFGLVSLFAARALAHSLWPEAPERARLVPWLLLGCLSWALFTTVTMFDMLMVTFASLAMIGLVRAWRAADVAGRAIGWAIVGAAVGLGALAKGPVILVYVLPAALLAPTWMLPNPPRWRDHYLGLAAALVLGTAIGLAWALPAAEAGGEAYRAAILWGQTAGRINDAFAHERPFWWYAALLPALLFPWVLWPPAWRGVRSAPATTDGGVRLGLAWGGAGVVVLSLISSKQPHYLLPLFPALALIVAAGLDRVRIGRWNAALPALFVGTVGAVLAAITYWLREDASHAEALGIPDWWRNITELAGLSLMLVALVIGLGSLRTSRAAIIGLTVQSVAVVVLLHALAFQPVAFAYDVSRMAHYIHDLQAFGRPVGMMGEYHGQFAFLGRLERPIRVIPEQAAMGWLEGDYRRRLVVVLPEAPPRWLQAEFAQLYRGRALALVNDDSWDAYATWLRIQARDRAAAAANAGAPSPAVPAASARHGDRPE